ncbi:Beta-1,4-glucuronyltransferase 1 [Eumeta japonica]|uniref:Beta-1,4-glucuronyltransferase 1 n=1 Tax=Eumeta variegata TaxID=151549 RepID=A0A4C1Z1B3_EUMVA|nr:Beta-1,4-glucuronyltransferase 1 [Eumeta japonica]
MTKCVRFCGAYTYRLTRRHSMILLIISFLLIILVILHLYARRHQNLRHGATVIGDFEYRPANFLKGQHPNETISYCRFNYGLPDEIRWSEITIHPTPEMGAESPYRVIYDVITGTAYAERAKHDAVTYVTQATPEFLYHVVEIARFWDGPISLSVFVPNYDLDTTMQIFKHLCHCYVGMSKVSLHIFYPKHLLPVIIKRESIATTSSPPTTVASNITREQILQQKLDNYRRLTNKTRAEYIKRARQKKAELMMVKLQDHRSYYQNVKFLDCSGPVSSDVPTYRKENNLVYPINVGRNVARNASRTNYFIVSDIEMVPSDGLAEKFLRMVRRLMGEKKRREGCVFAKTVFVVPLFEVESGEEIPRHKDT